MSESTTPQETGTDEPDPEALKAELELVRDENDRLRDEYARAKQITYRRTALALAGVGLLSVLTSVLIGSVREVLLVLGGIGIFGGILTWYLTPERIVTIDVGESVYDAMAANATCVHEELGLQPTTVYVPTGEGVKVFVPHHSDVTPPRDLGAVFQTAEEHRGVAWTPTGLRLVKEFEQGRTGPAKSTLSAVAVELGDALVSQFEIADSVAVNATEAETRVIVEVEGSAFGSLSRFDHPVVSTLASGAAQALEDPVVVTPVDDTTITLDVDTEARPE